MQDEAKIESYLKVPDVENQERGGKSDEDIVPTKYQGLPSELAEEMWEAPIYLDEKINREVTERREKGLAQIREREVRRETGKERVAQAQYDLLDEGQKREFPNLQHAASLRVAEHIKGVKIENLTSEEWFALGKAEDAWKAAQEKNPGTPLTMTFGREIDQKVYANLLNRLAFEQVKVKKAEVAHQQLNKVRVDLGLQPRQEVSQSERGSPQKKEQKKEDVSPENTQALSEVRRLLDRRIAKKPQFKQAQDALYDGFVARADKREIAELLMGELYHEKRTASYPQNPKYQEAWEYANRTKNIPAKAESGWLYRGTFPSKSEKSKTETRGSLNITITPEVVREMDSLIERGVIKANYKFGDPGEGGSADERHDAITIYFLEKPSDDALAALSEIAKRNFRGNTLLGKKVSEGFYISEVGSVSDTHAKEFIEAVKKSDERLGKAVEGYLTTKKGRTAMSEAQFYAVKDALKSYGYDISYDKENGLVFENSGRKEGEHSAKKKKWEEKSQEIDQITDVTGRGIDEGIKEAVTAFNVSEIPTSQSCEGHEEVEGGHRPWPWVEVGAPDEPEERFVGEAEAFAKTAQEKGVPLDELKKGRP